MSAFLNRRGFLRAAGHTLAGAALAGCASAGRSPANNVAVPIIDTHTHFYDPSRPQGVPWPPSNDNLLYRRVLPKDYRALPVPRAVTGTVVVEASSWLEDNQWVLDLAANDPFIVGLVGNLPIGTKEFAGHLKRFAANKIFRGIRIGARKADELQGESAFIRDLKLLAERDLSLDLLGGPEILPFAFRLAQIIPRLRIVIDHLAGVAVDGKAPPADWARQMKALATAPSIYFKISGLVEGTGKSNGSAPRDAAFYAPVLNAMREMFGPERLIYGSNWPVSERFAPLATVQGIVEDYFGAQGHRELNQVFGQSGKAAYRWTAPA
jgi:predicted TIM-barrel fold metal-dependent hydrolase